MPTLAANATRMPRSGIRAVMDVAWTIPDVIGLHVGEPSFVTPDHVLDGARLALDRHETRYVPNAGILPLREAIAAKVATHNGITASPGQVVVSAGGMQALYLALAASVSRGDEVLVPDPGWPNFAMAVQLLQARPVRYPLRPENGFQPDPADLDRLVTARTRAMIVNSPSNPLGTVLTPAHAEALCRFADAYDLWLISDECYDAITFDVPHVSPAAWDEAGRVLSCFSFSKTYAMTGMRVGYLVAPPKVAAVTSIMQEPLLSCVNAPAQRAALAALSGGGDFVELMRRTYQERRDKAAALLDEAGIGYHLPHGAFYLWLDVRDRCGGDVTDWALRLLNAEHVAVAPGTAFGPAGAGWARVCLATKDAALLEGLRRLVEFRD
ncbi:pyridoxal phosphate-dependent aminotransferase [Plantactinospora sp. GCM10030261]|uniref:pyridoxal phosphate-dependent aminotransferase n=1 Tax=Plantactinospora sp. GCM10030261 TaxID=3273420 RepID=UPI003617BF38